MNVGSYTAIGVGRINEKLILKRRAILGRDDGDDKTVTILIRLVTWVCARRLFGRREYVYLDLRSRSIQADPHHREILLPQMNLDGANVKSVATPVVKLQSVDPAHAHKA